MSSGESRALVAIDEGMVLRQALPERIEPLVPRNPVNSPLPFGPVRRIGYSARSDERAYAR